MKPAYYNEFKPYCAQWLRNLIDAGHIPAGDVDERDIREVDADDIRGYGQVHFFAGIGGWPYALRLAGWPDDRLVWTGSCPCQPFSSARRGRTNRDADLWPTWQRLIVSSRPGIVFGEQVAHESDWLDRVCDDLGALDYQVGAAVLPACSVGQDHIRPRIFFVGHANSNGKSRLPVNAKTSRVSRHRSKPRSMGAENGLSVRMARLRAYGNAIVPEVAAEFIRACP